MLLQQHHAKITSIDQVLQDIVKNQDVLNNDILTINTKITTPDVNGINSSENMIMSTANSQINVDEISDLVMSRVEGQLDLKAFYDNDEKLMNEIETLKTVVQSQQLVINGLSTTLHSILTKLDILMSSTEEKAKVQSQLEADEKAKTEAAAKAKREADEKAKREADEKAKTEAAAKAKREADEKAKTEAAAKAKREADEKAKTEAAAKAKVEAEEKAKREAEEKAKRDAQAAAEAKAKREAEAQALTKAMREAEEKVAQAATEAKEEPAAAEAKAKEEEAAAQAKPVTTA
jgi:chemotaxis protein histidine kinase CheA